jgi:glutamate synthase (NADPH/NADH) large chain
VAELLPRHEQPHFRHRPGRPEEKALVRHEMAFDDDVISLPVGGFYRYRARREPHALDGQLIHMLQKRLQHGQIFGVQALCAGGSASANQLRDLLDFKRNFGAVPLDEVQSITEIRKRLRDARHVAGRAQP